MPRSATRRLGHAIAEREVPDELLREIAETLEALAERVEHGQVRDRIAERASTDRWTGRLQAGMEHVPIPEGGRIEFSPDSFISGPWNPLGIGAAYTREGDEAVARVTVGPAFEGPPGRVHGGVVAALVDETLAALMPLTGHMGFTGSLSITLHAPAPRDRELEFRATFTGREGRRLLLSCVGLADGERFASAEATFVEIDPSVVFGNG